MFVLLTFVVDPLVRGLQRDKAVERGKAVGTVSIPGTLLNVSPLGAHKSVADWSRPAISGVAGCARLCLGSVIPFAICMSHTEYWAALHSPLSTGSSFSTRVVFMFLSFS